MRVIFVEDRRRDVDKVVTVLETTRFFEVEVLADYSEVDDKCLADAELFVLDILIAGSDGEFAKFIRKLRKVKKPFIAFTTNSEHTRLKSVSGDPPPPLREIVLEHGGLGMLSKRRRHDESKEKSTADIQLDLAEKILQFYWSKNPK